ncbi:helix-turn-helix domain-containing protein [uncultured Dechloromonas sp.]|uniref:AraC family transcriptional regulator n=1 Tax=uncultured Dechloromonas sp. TaxID=171719 RepID=UPI0025D422BE|nr:helix-turn-helix domain-containing protein [uncultured Dechloromonas sp.]
MKRFDSPPPLDLWPFIDRFWGCESEQAEVWPTLLPGTGAEIYLHYHQPFPGVGLGTHLACFRSESSSLGQAGAVGFVAIRFRTGMLARFTDHPLASLNDQVLDLEALWSGAGRVLYSRFLEAATIAERLALLHGFLRRQLRSGDHLVEIAADAIYQRGSVLQMAELATQSGLGLRQLERRFQAVLGVSPARLRGLVRFQKTCRQLFLDPDATILDTALAHDYYDHAHFCRNFRQLSGRSPQAYFSEARGLTHFYNTPRKLCGTVAPQSI